jgi:hypothetical protein
MLALVGILAVPLSYGIPLVGAGLDNLNLVRHFDHDEYYTYQAWSERYLRGPLHARPFDPNDYYPPLFYNLAGLLLYPYARLHGGTFPSALLVWRGLNLLASLGMVVMLFALARRVFRSTMVAAVSALLLAVTPDFLWWSTNVRPHPLEQLFTLAALYACVRLCEGFAPPHGMKWFWWAALFGASAFSSKYGGALFLALLPAVATWVIASGPSQPERSRLIREQARLGQRLIPWLLIPCMALGGWLLWAWWSHRGDGVALFLEWTQGAFAPPGRFERVRELLERHRTMLNALGALGLSGVVAGIAALGALWRWARMARMRPIAKPTRWTWLCLSALFAAYTASVYVGVYLASGPLALAHPGHWLARVGYMLHYIVLGGEHGAIQPSWLEALARSRAEFHPGWLLLLPGLGYAVVAHFRTTTPASSGAPFERRQRHLLWVFALGVVVIFVATKVIAMRHLLPAIAVLYAFVAEAAVRALHPATALIRRAARTGIAALASITLIWHGAEALDQHQGKRAQANDVGLQVGQWLAQRYDSRTAIMTDLWTFYVPPQFARATTTWTAMWAEKRRDQWPEAVARLLVSADPDVIIVTDPRYQTIPVRVEPLLQSDATLRNRGYHVVRQFSNPSRYGKHDGVLVYERGGR